MFASVFTPPRQLVTGQSPRYPLRYARRKSDRTFPVITDHVRFTGHVKNLQPHILPVQNTRHPPTDPSVQGEFDPIIRPSRELPAPGCYFQPDSGKLEPDTISFRRNRCCDSILDRTGLPCHLPTPSVRLSSFVPLSALLRQPGVLDIQAPHNWQSQRAKSSNLSPRPISC